MSKSPVVWMDYPKVPRKSQDSQKREGGKEGSEKRPWTGESKVWSDERCESRNSGVFRNEKRQGNRFYPRD